MTERYDVRVSKYEENQGWDNDLIGKVRSYFVYDTAAQSVIAKMPVNDSISRHRGDPFYTNDPILQEQRAYKLCEYMNKVEQALLTTMAETAL